jgi:polygalacturonase
MNLRRIKIVLGFVLAITTDSVVAQVKSYPPSPDAVQSEIFLAKAGAKAIFVSNYMDYHYAHFELSGTTEIEVTANENITSFTISPQSLNIIGTVNGDKLSFTINQIKTNHEIPAYLVVQINELEKLVILADRPEVDVPQAKGEGIYNVRATAYNADSTGVTSAQSAIQKAIDDASNAGGGIVYIPYGLYQIKQNLALKDNVSLYIEAGSVLKAIADRSEYPMVSGIDPAVIIHDAENVKIYGRGEINASGLAIMNPDLGFTEQSVEHPRRRVIETDHAQNVVLDGIIVKDGTGWTVELKRSDTVDVQEIKVLNHKDINYKIQNDGINSTSSSNTLVNQCFVMTIDDAMCSKARYNDMQNCTFSNNVIFTHSAGVKAGMQSVGNMRNIVFRNCDVIHARRGVGIDTREGYKPIKGVVFNDIRVEELEPTSGGGDYAVEFATTYAPVDNITIRRVTSPNNNKIMLTGDYDITNIQFEGIELNNQLVMSDDMAQVVLGSGINITYSYDSLFSDDIFYKSSFSDISSGWVSPELINNGIKTDVSSNSAAEAWIEFSFTEVKDIHKARVFGANDNETTWMIKYQNDTTTIWSNAFPDVVPITQGWSNKTFYAHATKIRFYFYNSGGNINVNEIQCFANIVDVEDGSGDEGNKHCLLIEPEDLSKHDLFAPFYVADNEGACNGQYIESDVNGDLNAPDAKGRVVASFYIDSTARYHIYLRVIAPSINDDSFWIITDGDAVRYNLIEASTDWIWVEAPKSYELKKGLHKLQIVNRESNTKLDQILISTSPDLPTDCASCANVYDPSIVYYTLNSTVNGSGSIIMEPNDGIYQSGTSVTLTAVPDKDYLFYGWSGDAVSTSNPLTVVMDTDKNITANFIEDSTLQVGISNTIEHEEHVRIYPNPASDVFYVEPLGNAKGTVSLYRIDGVAVRKQYIEQKTIIRTNDIPEGLYLIQYVSDNGKVKYSQSLYIDR